MLVITRGIQRVIPSFSLLFGENEEKYNLCSFLLIWYWILDLYSFWRSTWEGIFQHGDAITGHSAFFSEFLRV